MASVRPKVKLYWLNDSRAQRIVWLLTELDLDFEIVPFHRDPKTLFAPPDLEKVHPLGKAPLVGLTFPDRGDKETILAESGFIAQYLCEHFGQGTHLVPPRYEPGREGQPGGETEAWMRWQYLLHYVEGSLMPPLLVALVLNILKGPKIPFVIRPITAAVVAKTSAVFVQPNIRKHIAFLESLLKTSPGGGQFLCGEHLTAADILMSYPLRDGEGESSRLGDGKGGNMLDAFPAVRAYLERLESQPGFKRAQERIDEVEGKINGVSKS